MPRKEKLWAYARIYMKSRQDNFSCRLEDFNNKATKSVALGRWLGGTKVPYI